MLAGGEDRHRSMCIPAVSIKNDTARSRGAEKTTDPLIVMRGVDLKFSAVAAPQYADENGDLHALFRVELILPVPPCGIAHVFVCFIHR